MNVAKDKTNQAYYKLKALLEARQWLKNYKR
jgi:hypothetical protein